MLDNTRKEQGKGQIFQGEIFFFALFVLKIFSKTLYKIKIRAIIKASKQRKRLRKFKIMLKPETLRNQVIKVTVLLGD